MDIYRITQMLRFGVVNALFLAALAVLLIYQVNSWMLWLGFVAIWFVAEDHFAPKIHLKTWHWVLIIAGILAIDLAVLGYLGLLNDLIGL